MSKRLDIFGKIVTFLETKKNKKVYTYSEIAKKTKLHQNVVKSTFQIASFIKENFPEFNIQTDKKKRKDSNFIIFEDNKGELIVLLKKEIELSEKILKELGRRK